MTEFAAPSAPSAASATSLVPDYGDDPEDAARYLDVRDSLSVGAEVSDLEALGEELAPVIAEPVDLDVPLRPGYAIRCRTDFTGKDLDSYRAKARDKRFVDGIDGVKAASLTLGATCIAILRNGREVMHEGQVVTFATAAFQGQLGTREVDTTVRRFFGSEGHVDDAANRLLREAGYGGGEVTVSDPTS